MKGGEGGRSVRGQLYIINNSDGVGITIRGFMCDDWVRLAPSFTGDLIWMAFISVGHILSYNYYILHTAYYTTHLSFGYGLT